MDIFETIAQVYQEEIENQKNSLAQGNPVDYHSYKQVVGYIAGIEWAKQNLRDIVQKQLYIEDEKREGYEDLSINEIEKNFDTNLKDYSGRFLKNKISSNNFFRNNDQEFDVIYIDGSHYAPDVLEDCKNSWSVLKKNGILILDDYFWKGYAKIEENPAFAINQFLKEANNKYEVANFSKYQLFLRKLN